MPNILVLGAAGYIGSQVATQLIQTGQHIVYGSTRSASKAKQIAKQEIIPVVCPDPVNNPEPYLSIIRTKHIDVVIDLMSANAGAKQIVADLSIIGQERLAEYAKRGITGPKLGFIYCSGIWVHGHSTEPMNDLDLVGPGTKSDPVELVTWRIAVEDAVLSAKDVLDVMILRPALVYGREGIIWSRSFTPVLEAAKSGSDAPVEIPLDADARTCLIHVDDTASAFRKAVEKLAFISGTGVYPVFDLFTSQESLQEIFNALAASWGVKGGVVLKGHAAGGNLFDKAMSSTLRGSAARAQQILEWKPTRLNGYANDMDIFAAAFKAQ